MTTTMMGLGGTISLICMIWVLYEVWAVNRSLQTGEKVIWSIAAFFFNIITALIYYFVVKRKSIA